MGAHRPGTQGRALCEVGRVAVWVGVFTCPPGPTAGRARPCVRSLFVFLPKWERAEITAAMCKGWGLVGSPSRCARQGPQGTTSARRTSSASR